MNPSELRQCALKNSLSVSDALLKFRDEPTRENAHLALIHARNCAAALESLMRLVSGQPEPVRGNTP